ncbi:MAG: TRAP transporter substrate-binding protein [Roseibium sp.]|uniref:TRAP transporter substrate-binding protein n=1 Tax=Roseibium sp. TaxID=1936156 RepID=UPI001B2BBF84|nr:TRAP transporter substrate-binding protein [Roseibium sp.]MBO6891971.1 TRAP transporter substrate-binding protein [Roseibium sp.]MBO6930014.1 TRAP transporter substrate-binding protein [Roseibium sp.]
MKNLKKAVLGAALFALGATTAGAADYEFKLHHFLGEKAPAHSKMLAPWAKQVEENSGGKVSIEIFPAMTLGGRPPELINQVRDGVVDLVWTVNGYTPGLFPRSEVFELPGVHTNDTAATNLALMDLFESDLKEEYKGVEVMFLHVHSGQGIHMTDAEVRSPADLAGKKMRIPTRTGAWVIEALGAIPVGMPVPELPTALQKGVIDGALIPWEIIPPLKIQEQTKYQIEGADKERFGTTVFQVSMNKARWDSLPDDVKQAFRDASGRDWRKTVGDIWAGADDFGIGLATKAGNTHITLTPEETAAFNEALAPVADKWAEEVSAKGIDGAGLVEKAKAAVAKNASN